jgi:phage terminase large subunit-like protein
MTRGERVIAFIEGYLRVPEGSSVGKPFRLMSFQKRFIEQIYDNPAGTSRAYLSIARKNGKSALIAAIGLAHIVGPEARQNTQIISGARSRDQAALVFGLMVKMLRFSPELSALTRIVPSSKQIVGLPMHVEYKAISAEAGTAHGLSPVLAILDEVGQIKGPHDSFVEAITTSQGAHEDPLLIAISTQAATDNDLFSRWLDDAAKGLSPRVIVHLHSAPADCDLMDRDAWRAANPALGEFRSERDMEGLAEAAVRMPTDENSFRWLNLNQRIEAAAPFVSPSVWKECAGPVVHEFEGLPVYAGLDLSQVSDLTAFVMVAPVDGIWHVKPVFWLPGEEIGERSKRDRVPYDLWARQGFLETTPGRTVDYDFVAEYLWRICETHDVRKIAFDRWNWRHLKPRCAAAGFPEHLIEGDTAIFQEFGQGMRDMTPALRDLEGHLLTRRIAHGGHPVLESCARNAVIEGDAAGGRKFAKNRSRGRIDGMVALAMAVSVAGTWQAPEAESSYLDDNDLLVL